VRTYSNKVYWRQFIVSRTTSCSSRTERHSQNSPHCRLPAFQCAWVHWTRKLAVEQSRSKSRGLFSVDSVAADGVTSQNFRHWSAEASFDRLLGSSKPGHTNCIVCTLFAGLFTWLVSIFVLIFMLLSLSAFLRFLLKKLLACLNRAIDQLPKKLRMVIKAKGGHVEFLSGLTICVRDRPCFTVFRMKLNKTHAPLSNPMQFWGYWRFMHKQLL